MTAFLQGKNMKRILDVCKGNFSLKPVQNIVKLRLRGKGSGFKEGPERKGSWHFNFNVISL